MLNPEGLAELGSDFTGKYSTRRMPSQVTVLKMYQSNGLWKGTEKKNQRQNPHPWTAKGCGTRSYFCASMCDPRRPSISAPPAGGRMPRKEPTPLPTANRKASTPSHTPRPRFLTPEPGAPGRIEERFHGEVYHGKDS